jgi:hypothetical protein
MVSVFLGSRFGAFANGSAFFSPAIPIKETYTNSSLDMVLSTETTADTMVVNQLEYTTNNGGAWSSLNPNTTIEGTKTYSFSVTAPASGWYFNLRQVSGSAKILKFVTVHHNKPGIK